MKKILLPAYFVATYNVANRDVFTEYQALALPMLKKFNCKALTLGTNIIDNIIEGDQLEMTVVLEFPSAEDAKAWYRSEEYQKILPMRLESVSNARACIVEGLPLQEENTEPSLQDYHKAAKVIEEEGIDGFKTAVTIVGKTIATALAIAHLRRQMGSMESYPEPEGLTERVNAFLTPDTTALP